MLAAQPCFAVLRDDKLQWLVKPAVPAAPVPDRPSLAVPVIRAPVIQAQHEGTAVDQLQRRLVVRASLHDALSCCGPLVPVFCGEDAQGVLSVCVGNPLDALQLLAELRDGQRVAVHLSLHFEESPLAQHHNVFVVGGVVGCVVVLAGVWYPGGVEEVVVHRHVLRRLSAHLNRKLASSHQLPEPQRRLDDTCCTEDLVHPTPGVRPELVEVRDVDDNGVAVAKVRELIPPVDQPAGVSLFLRALHQALLELWPEIRTEVLHSLFRALKLRICGEGSDGVQVHLQRVLQLRDGEPRQLPLAPPHRLFRLWNVPCLNGGRRVAQRGRRFRSAGADLRSRVGHSDVLSLLLWCLINEVQRLL
eukprot:Sspe_Gene.66078::Locus_39059_Transcript_1_1_Confidence_1.000_Length_1972::g.66078::m.66078